MTPMQRTDHYSCFGEIIDGGFRSGDSFVVLSPRHPASRQRFGYRTKFVEESMTSAVPVVPTDYSDMRPEELVRRTSQPVAVPFCDIRQTVRRIVHSVREKPGHPTAWDCRQISFTGLMLPTMFEAHPDRNQPSVRGDSLASKSVKSSVQSDA